MHTHACTRTHLIEPESTGLEQIRMLSVLKKADSLSECPQCL